MDNRIFNTKKKIKDSLVKLLSKKRLYDISVSELCQTANVNRSTFYVYYNNVYEVFEEIGDEIAKEMKEMLVKMDRTDHSVYLRVYFTLAKKHMTIFKEIHSTNIHNPIIQKLAEVNSELLNSNVSVPKKTENLELTFVLSGFYGLVETWLNNGCKESDDDLIQVLKSFYGKL